MRVYKHVVYGSGQTVAEVISDLDDPAWRLGTVVPAGAGTFVAVFEREIEGAVRLGRDGATLSDGSCMSLRTSR